MQRLNLFGLMIIGTSLAFGACKTSRPSSELAESGAAPVAPKPSKIIGTPVKLSGAMLSSYNNGLDPDLTNLPGWKANTFVEDCKQISINNSLILAMEDARPFATGDYLALDFEDKSKQDLWSFETESPSGNTEIGPYREQGVFLTRVSKGKRAKTLGYRYLLADPENGSCYLRSERYKSSEADMLLIDSSSLALDVLPRPTNRDQIYWKDRCRIEAVNRTLKKFFADANDAKIANPTPSIDNTSTFWDHIPETKERRYQVVIKNKNGGMSPVVLKFVGTRTDTTCDLKPTSF